MRFKKQILIFISLIMLLCISQVPADIFVADGFNNQVVGRYSPDGDMIWQRAGRSIKNITVGVNDELVYMSRNWLDKMLSNYDASTGENYDKRFQSGIGINDAAWGPDYNGDGESDLYVVGNSDIWVVDVDDSDISNVSYTVLATWTAADSDGANGTGGNAVFIGPDQNGDGVEDIYVSKGGNTNDNWINIWDSMTGGRVGGVDLRDGDYDGTRGVRDMIISPQDSGKLWVVDEHRNEVRAVDLNTLENIGAVDLGVNFDNPTDIAKADDGTVYISTRFATDLSDNYTEGNEDPYGNIIEYDPSGQTAELLLETEEGGRFDTVEYTSEEEYVAPSGNLFMADSENAQVVARYSPDAELIWQRDGRSIVNLTIGRDGELVYMSKNWLDKMLSNYDASTGENYDNRFQGGAGINDAAWGPDYNGDGDSDLYVIGNSDIWVADVDDSDKANVTYTTLATWTVADSDGANGTGGNAVFVGPDQNGNGVEDIYVSKGGNSDDNWINIWDSMTGNRIGGVDLRDSAYDGTRQAEDMIISPHDSNNLWVVDHYRNEIRAVDLNTLENIGAVDLGVNFDNPTDIIKTDSGIVYISTRFATDLSDNNTESNEDPYGNIIRYVPSSQVAELWFETEEGQRVDTIAHTDEEAPVFTSELSGNLIVTDAYNEQYIRRYSIDGILIWDGYGPSGTRHINGLTMGRNNELVWASRGGVENMLVNYDAKTGLNYDNRFMHGTEMEDAEWGPDYNGDGKSDLYVAGSDTFWVVDINDTDQSNVVYTTLATWNAADTDGANGTGGQGICFGPDQNGDGVEDLYAGKGWNTNDNWVNIWDPTAADGEPNRIAGIDMRDGEHTGSRGITEVMVSPLDTKTLWILDTYRNSMRAADLNTLENTGKVEIGVNLDNPTDIVTANNGDVFISTRFATDLSSNDTDAEDAYGNIVQYDPVTGEASLWMETSEGGRIDAIEYVNEELELPCPDRPSADINEDCKVDYRDLNIFVADWLECTDPNTANCQ